MIPNKPIYVRLEPNGGLPSISTHAPFKAVVIVEGSYPPEWQDQVSHWLVDAGCRYMLAWGTDCSSWDDSVDHASVVKDLPGETPDSEFVMTTWHDNQTLEDVFWQSQFNAQFSYDDVELKNTILIHICDTDREEWMTTLFERSKTLADREPD